MANRRTVVDVVESIRRFDLPQQLWLKEILERLHPFLSDGTGIFGCFFDASNLNAVQFTHAHTLDAPSGTIEGMSQTDIDPETTTSIKLRWFSRPATVVSDILGDEFRRYRPWQRYLEPCGVGDMLLLNAVDDQLRGLAISVPYQEIVEQTPEQIALLERISAHLLVANTLRRQAAHAAAAPKATAEATAEATMDATVEAILTPDGRVAHATGVAALDGARRALSDAVRAAERARGKLRRVDPREALELWQAMAGGRWSLVDEFDSDGRRYVVARVTDVVAATPGVLSKRESQVAKLAALGHSNKMIAYELGLSTSTVATYLSRAVEKSGARSVRDLVRTILRAHLPSA